MVEIKLVFEAGASENSTSSTISEVTVDLKENGFMVSINGSRVAVNETLTAIVPDANGTSMAGETHWVRFQSKIPFFQVKEFKLLK